MEKGVAFTSEKLNDRGSLEITKDYICYNCFSKGKSICLLYFAIIIMENFKLYKGAYIPVSHRV